MALAENLKLLRKRKGLTQKDLSDLSGVSCNSIINYENSRRTSPPISILQKLARALDVSVDVLTATRIANRKDGGIQIYVGPPQDLPVDDWEEFVIERGEQDIVEQLSELVKQLNKEGVIEALKRVRELTEIQRYSITPVTQQPNPFPNLRSPRRDRKWEDVEWQEDAPPTAVEPNPGSDQTDAGK